VTIVGVVADANVLLSAAIGKGALKVFSEFDVAAHATRFNCDEVEEYLPRLATQYSLPLELVEMQWRLLPVRVHVEDEYAGHVDRARSRVADRDPEDAHALALAMRLDLPLWSNDNDLAGHGVRRYTTAELLRILQARKPKS